MNLDNYLRSVVKQNMLKYLNVCSCEECGSTNDLEIHHDDIYFFEMVDKTLKDLNIPYYQEKDKYDEFEIEKISIYILGLHIKSKYRILCKECHTKLHKECIKRRHRKIDNIDRESCLQYLKQLQGKHIYSNDRNDFRQLLKVRYIGIECINNTLDELFGEEYPYRLYSKDANGKRYVDKIRRLNDGSLNPNRDKTYWVLR